MTDHETLRRIAQDFEDPFCLIDSGVKALFVLSERLMEESEDEHFLYFVALGMSEQLDKLRDAFEEGIRYRLRVVKG